MHPTMIMALANEIERERQNERREVQVLALANRIQGFVDHRAIGPARRLIGGISLRSRPSWLLSSQILRESED